MKPITGQLYDWGEWKTGEIQHNPHSHTSILYRYETEGNIQVAPSRDRILCYDPKNVPGYINAINRAWLGLSRREHQCVFGKFVATQIYDYELGRVRTEREVAVKMKIGWPAFKQGWTRGRQHISTRIKLE